MQTKDRLLVDMKYNAMKPGFWVFQQHSTASRVEVCVY
jgi:hypothetical protein